jgi:hypothetical protein
VTSQVTLQTELSAAETDALRIRITASLDHACPRVQEQMVGLALADHEIRRRVVLRITIDVMHNRAFRQRLPERLFRDDHVLPLPTCRGRIPSPWVVVPRHKTAGAILRVVAQEHSAAPARARDQRILSCSHDRVTSSNGEVVRSRRTLIAFDGSAHFTTGKGKFVEQAEHDTVPFGSMVSVGFAPGLFIAPHF